MKEYYQPRGGKKGKFALRENTYRRTWYLIADYPYFKAVERGMADAGDFTGENREEKNENGFNVITVENKSSRVAETVAGYETARDQYRKYIKAIEDAMEQIPERYADHIMRHITERKKYKDIEGVSETTLKLWTQRFIWNVANNMGDV